MNSATFIKFETVYSSLLETAPNSARLPATDSIADVTFVNVAAASDAVATLTVPVAPEASRAIAAPVEFPAALDAVKMPAVNSKVSVSTALISKETDCPESVPT